MVVLRCIVWRGVPIGWLMKRLKIRGRGVIDWPGNELDGAKVWIIERLRDCRLMVRTRPPEAETLGVLMRIEAEKVRLESP